MTPQADSPKGRQESGPGAEIMRLLELALKPVEPPASFVDKLEVHLENVEAAALEALEELSDWELEAMRDPRNWARPAAAVAVREGYEVQLLVPGARIEP